MSDDTIPLFNIANGRGDLETWLPIEGYEGLYEVSDHGQVRRLARPHTLSTGKVLQYKAQLIKGWIGPFGHRSLHLSKTGSSKKKWYVHRLVAYTFIGAPESCDLEVCHNDGDSSNNHVSNLRWDTHSSNQWDQVAHGKHSNASRTHCRRGHPLSGLNLIEASSGNGHRNCRTCRKASDYFRYHKTPPSESAAVYEEIYNRVINGINLRPRRG